MKASYCIEGRIHNHKLMDTIIVMGSANIRHNNENEKRFFFWLSSSSYFVFSCMKQKDLLICQEPSTVFKIEQKSSILRLNCLLSVFKRLLNSILWGCIERKKAWLSTEQSPKNDYNQFVCKISPYRKKEKTSVLGQYNSIFCPSLKIKCWTASLVGVVVYREILLLHIYKLLPWDSLAFSKWGQQTWPWGKAHKLS